MRDPLRSLAEFTVDNIHCCPLKPPGSHAFKGNQVDQAKLPLVESKVTIPDKLLSLYMLRDDNQDEAFHRLFGD